MVRPFASVLALIVTLFVVVSLLISLGTGHSRAKPLTTEGPLVIVAAPGLNWQQVTATRMPDLWQSLDYGAMGSQLTSRSGDPVCTTRAFAGLGAGTDVRGLSCAPTTPTVNGTTASWPRWTAWRTSTGADLGELASAYGAHGRCVQAVGAGAALAAADRSGKVSHYRASVTGADLAACPLSIVDASQGAATTTMAQLNAVFTAVPSNSTVIVTGLSDGRSPSTSGLRFVYTLGHTVTHGRLGSGSVRHPGLIAIGDLTATALAQVGPVPSAVQGRPLSIHGDKTPSATLAREARSLDAHLRQVPGAALWFTVLWLAGVVGGAIVLWRSRSGGFAPVWLPPLLVGWGSLPVGAYLASWVPWWRWPIGLLWLVLASLVFAALIAAIAYAGAWRRVVGLPAAVAGGLSAAIIAMDSLHGGGLQLTGLFGPAAWSTRPWGLSAAGFGIMAAGLLVFLTREGNWLVRQGESVLAVAVIAVATVAAAAIAGWPGWGDNGQAAMMIALLGAVTVAMCLLRSDYPAPPSSQLGVTAVLALAAVLLAFGLGGSMLRTLVLVAVPMALSIYAQSRRPEDRTIRISRRETDPRHSNRVARASADD